MSIYQAKNKILKNAKIRGNYFKLLLESPQIAGRARPGQFVTMKASENSGMLLRKPLGIHRISKSGAIEVLYEVIGKGTDILSKRKAGEYLDVMGPLGNGFDYSSPVCQFASLPVLVAGGIGVAPLLFLAEELKNQRTKERKNTKVVALIGAKTKSCILCKTEFKELGCEVMVTTDDGSKGHKGFVTDLLKSLLSSIQYPVSSIYACGPMPMLKEAAAIAARHKVPCQVLLEEYMACGIGVCLGCPVMTKDGYKMVCKDGPVFEASEIVWK